MIAKQVWSVTLASCLAWCGCEGGDPPTRAGDGFGDGGRTSAGNGGAAPVGNGGRAGSAGSVAGPSTGGAGASSNGGSTGGGASSDPNSEGDAVPSAGCDRAPRFQSGNLELEVDGVPRTFILDVPSDYDASKPYPLVFGFHGRDFTAAEFRDPSYGNLLSAIGDDAVLVHPNATMELWAWDLDTPQDVVFFDAMLEALTQGLCIDEARVFATGHSSGGYFTNLLGCQRGNVLRAIAPLAGGGPYGVDDEAPACEGPVSALIVHAEDDEIVPFLEGEGSLDHWLASDACDAESSEPVVPDPCVEYEGCSSGLAVRWCAYTGGHDWPSFAAGAIWDFFRSF